VFQSFFIYKILVHQTIFRNIRKIQKIQNKFKIFFGGFKIRTHYLGVNNPSICLLEYSVAGPLLGCVFIRKVANLFVEFPERFEANGRADYGSQVEQ